MLASPTTIARCAFAVAVCHSAGCASAWSAEPTAAQAKPSPMVAEVARLRALGDRQAQRLAELEARLALLEAEARETRRADTGKIAETVRIGAASSADEASDSEPDSEPVAELESDERPPIKLRLSGHPSGAPSGLLEPVPVVAERLPVVPLPGERARAQPPAVGGAAVAQRAQAGDPREAYLQALGLLKHRRYDEAAVAFRQFVDNHPQHPLVSSAVYWQGEARYAMREYPQALAAFSRVVERFPTSEKLSKALYKLGLCHERLGDPNAAQRSFDRLRAEFPDSELAKRTSSEGSS